MVHPDSFIFFWAWSELFFPFSPLSFFPPLLMHAFNSWINSVNELTLISLSGSKNSELLISKFLEPVFWNRALFCFFLSLCSFSVSLLDVLSLFKCSFLVLDYPVSFVQHLFKMYLFILNKAPLFFVFLAIRSSFQNTMTKNMQKQEKVTEMRNWWKSSVLRHFVRK